MEKIKKLQNVVATASLALAAVGLGTVAISVFISVLCRYVFKTSAMWVEQYTRYMLIWVVFLSANVLIYKNSLVRVDFLDHIWPKTFLQVRDALYTALFLVILGVLLWQGWLQAVSFWGVPLTGLPIDKFWIYLSVPVGALLMLFQYLLNLLTMALNWKGGGGDT